MQKYPPALVVSLWVIALAAGGAAIALRTWRSEVQAAFDASSSLRIAALQRSLDEKMLLLQSMQSLYAIFDGKPQPQFRSFVQPFEQELQGVQALQWVVPVTAAERDRFERSLQAAGINGFQITERNADGVMVRAAERTQYFPVYPLLPLDEGEASIGFDIASSPERKTALDTAIATGALATSGRIELLQQNVPGEYGFLVLAPLFANGGNVRDRTSLLGLVLGVFRLSSIVAGVQAQFAPEPMTLDIRDDSANQASALLFSGTTSAADTDDPWPARYFRPGDHVEAVSVGNRQWQVRTSAAAGYMAGKQPLLAALVFASGALMALGLSVYLVIRTSHEARLQAADKQRESLENQLVRAQRLEAIGQLVGGIAHDFKNLLQSVLGNVELLLLEPGDARPQARHQLGHIQRAAERGNGLIQKLLSFSRNEPAQPTVLSLPPQIDNTLSMLRPLIPASISFTTELAADLPPVLIDATSFDQVLVNLCINARDAIDGSGHISIKLQKTVLTGTTCHSCRAQAAGEHVLLELSDSGSGIAADTLAHIFDPFFTTKALGKGTGLGLSIVHNIVHGAGGHILLESIPGHGSTFRILFPAARQNHQQGLRIAG